MCVFGGYGGKECGLMNRPTDFRVTVSRCWQLVVTVFSEEEESVSVKCVGVRAWLGPSPMGREETLHGGLSSSLHPDRRI